MVDWITYNTLHTPNTVIGDLRVCREFYSPQLQNKRDILVWLPPSYASSERRYPVLYMHDGQNVFDAHTSYAGEWRVDETLTDLAREGIEAIVVGLPNANEMRSVEYSPYPFMWDRARIEGKGDVYLQFLVDTVKPLIDQSFRTRPEAGATGIAGSSMGGLISLHGFLTHPETFGFCGALSTAYWFGANHLLQTTRTLARGTGRVYLDVGTHEGPTLTRWDIRAEDLHAAYTIGVRKLRDALLEGGYIAGTSLLYIEAEGAMHNEAAWAERFPNALRFLIPR